MAKIKFVEKDQVWQNERTNYWFTVNSESFAVSDQNGELTLLDCDGCPIEKCNDHNNVLEALIPEYKKHIKE